jgi:amidase
MSRSLNSCAFFLQAISAMHPENYDATVIPFQFDKALYLKSAETEKMAFGVMRNDGIVRPDPPVARAIEEAVQKLKAAGHSSAPYFRLSSLDVTTTQDISTDSR